MRESGSMACLAFAVRGIASGDVGEEEDPLIPRLPTRLRRLFAPVNAENQWEEGEDE
jgi:hypothetical protein